MGLWHIAEAEIFFAERVALQREITHPHKRLQHLAGRYLLTQLVPGFPNELIQIADTRKPYLPGEAWHFSLSHCGDYAAAIVSRDCVVGVDVEAISPKVQRVQHKFLTVAESALAATADWNGSRAQGDGYLTFLTTCWSIKEALFKWRGTGEVDFKAHLCIERVELSGNSGKAHCRVLKAANIPLVVDFLVLDQHCLSWVVQR